MASPRRQNTIKDSVYMLERTLEAFEGAYIYRGKIIDHPDDHQISDPRNQGGRGSIGGRAPALAQRSIVSAGRIWRPGNIFQDLPRHARQLGDVHRDKERLVA